MPELGVNIDHIATIRQARRTIEPDPVWAAVLAELAGAMGITLHLREDRRHIQDRDLYVLKQTVQVKLNLEMAATAEMTRIAIDVHPQQVTLVPESREEITTEGGLDVIQNQTRLQAVIEDLQAEDIEVSLFIDPDKNQIAASSELRANAVELHTGQYAEAVGTEDIVRELDLLEESSQLAQQQGLILHAGHGLTYRNVRAVAEIPGLCELNIGHSIVARAVMVGFEEAVREMVGLIQAD